MVNGNGVKVTFAQEEEYGKYKIGNVRVAVSSEGFKYSANKKDEGLLTGGVGKSMVETMSLHTEGDIATLAKPRTIGYFLAGVFGVESVDTASTDGKYKHTFTPIGNKETDLLPSYCFTIDRGVNIQSYTGVKFASISFSAAAEDRLNLTLSTSGREEKQDGQINDALKVENSKAFKFHQASVKMDGEKVADITSINFDYNNNLDTSLYTTDTGLYAKEPKQGARECTAKFEALYTAKTEAIRNGKFKTDAIVSLEIEFTDSENNRLIFRIPTAQVSEMETPTAGGAETMKTSLTVSAVDDLEHNYVEVELFNDIDGSYLERV